MISNCKEAKRDTLSPGQSCDSKAGECTKTYSVALEDVSRPRKQQTIQTSLHRGWGGALCSVVFEEDLSTPLLRLSPSDSPLSLLLLALLASVFSSSSFPRQNTPHLLKQGNRSFVC